MTRILFYMILQGLLLANKPIYGFVLNTRPTALVNNHRHGSSSSSSHRPLLILKETSSSSSQARDAITWIYNEPLDSLLPKEEALLICNELLSSKELIDDTEAVVKRNWEKLEERIRTESRSIQELLGQETTDRLLQSIQNFDLYDSDSVKAFLESEAVNELFAKVLYDGIYEFFQTIDVFGNIISNLPIIGPIRNQIRDEIKRNLDRTLGPLVQSFLRSYTKVAVLQASDFVMSPANRKAFGSANVRLVSSILERPLSSLLPTSSDWSEKLRKDAFDYIRNNDSLSSDLERYADFVYDLLGDKRMSQVVDVERILDSSPTLEKTVNRIWDSAITKRE